MGVTKSFCANGTNMPIPFGNKPLVAPFQRPLWEKVDPIRDIIDKGLIIDSPDIGASKQPDGRVQLYLKKPTQPIVINTVPVPTGLVTGTFTEFYCVGSGSNLNAGSDQNALAKYTSTNGNWSTTTNVFTPTDGTNPVAAGVAVGDWASIYVDGATVGVCSCRITAVTNGANGPITVSATARAGTVPSTSATARSIKVGGGFKGPSGASGYPLSISFLNAKDTAGHMARINLKNEQQYNITARITVGGSNVVIQGYTSTPGDGGKAVIDAGTTAIATAMMSMGSQTGIICNLIFQNNGSTGTGAGCLLGGSWHAIGCGFNHLRGDGLTASTNSTVSGCSFNDCNQSNTNTLAALNAGTAGPCFFANNVVTNSKLAGIRTAAAIGGWVIENNTVSGINPGDGIQIPASTVAVRITGNTVSGCTDAVSLLFGTNSVFLVHAEGNAFSGNGGNAINEHGNTNVIYY